MRVGVGRVDIGVVLRDAVLADQRLGQPVGMVHIVEAEAALDAEPVVVGRPVLALDRDDVVVLDLVGQLAADAAIGADAVDLAVGGVGEDAVLRRPGSPASARRSGRPARIRRRRRRSQLPIGSSKSNTIFSWWPRAAMPITSLTCTSRQARTQRLHWMQASSCTAIAGWLRSGPARRAAGKRLSLDLQPVGPLPQRRVRVVRGGARRAGRRPAARTPSCARLWRARWRSAPSCPAVGLRMHDAASTRSPSISTMQARQLPSAR